MPNPNLFFSWFLDLYGILELLKYNHSPELVTLGKILPLEDCNN